MKKNIVFFNIAFIVKLLTAWYLLYLTNAQKKDFIPEHFSVVTEHYPVSEDTMEPMENYVSKGSYFRWTGQQIVYAGRMPHYTVPYYFFRLVFNKAHSFLFVALLQILIESLSIICLSLLAEKIFHSIKAFYWVYVIQLVSTGTSIFNFFMDPISLSISVIIISIYFFYKFLEAQILFNLIVSGILFGLGVTFRPYMGIVYPAFFLVLLFIKGYKNILTLSKLCLLFFIPLTILILPWAIRNYNIYHKFIPMQINNTAGEKFPNSHFAYRRYISSWGESFHYWDKKSAGSYFEPNPTGCEFEFPDYVFTKNYSLKEIEQVRNNFIIVKKTYNDSLDKEVENQFNKMTAEFIAEKPFRYYFFTPVLLLKKFLLHSGSYYLPIGKSLPSYENYQMLIKLLQSFLYHFTLFVGMIGLTFLFFANKNHFILLAIPLSLLIFFCFIFKDVGGFHYFSHSYPFLVVGSFWSVKSFLQKLRNLFKRKHLTQ